MISHRYRTFSTGNRPADHPCNLAHLMSAQLDPLLSGIQDTVLTPKQLAAYRLRQAGLSDRRIAVMLGISRTSVRDRLFAADGRVRKHIRERPDLA